MNHPVLQWIKANVYIVVFVVLMLAAAISMPIVSGKMNAKVQKEVKTRASKKTELANLEKTDLSSIAPGQQALVNQKLLDAYRKAVKARNEDADALFAAAVEHNRKGRGVIMPELLPKPPAHLVEVLPANFFEDLMVAYEVLLEDINAGVPPDPNEVLDLLRRREAQFRDQILARETGEELDEQGRRELQKELTSARTSSYVQAGQAIKLYASLAEMELPRWDPSRLPTLSEMFEWQMRFWILEDVLHGLAAANADSQSVIQAPVKRVVWAEVEAASEGSSGGGSGSSGPAGFGAGGGGGGGGRGGKGGAAAARPLNPKAEAPLNYGASITGRQTNSLYDVRYVDLILVVDPQRLPEIMDALARRNFMTAVSIRLESSDPFAALKQGYFYGSGTVSKLQLRLETIYLRPWVTPFMPDAVKQKLGIPIEQAKPEQA